MLLRLTHHVLLKGPALDLSPAEKWKGNCFECSTNRLLWLLFRTLSCFLFPFICAVCQKCCSARDSTRRRREGNHLRTFGMQQMPLPLGGSLELLFSCSSLIVALQRAAALLNVCERDFRILNSKGWGLIMEPDSSSPASICLTVPPISPFIPSLPLVPPSQFLIRCISPWQWPSFLLLSSSSLTLSASPSGPSVFQGHVRGVEEHVGVIVVVVIAEVGQVSLRVAYSPRMVLADPSPVTQPWLQSQLENNNTHRIWM